MKLEIFFILLFGISLMAVNSQIGLALEEMAIPENQNDLGVITSSELHPEAVGIKECGLSAWVKQKWTFDNVKSKGNNLIFPENAKEIFWFAQFTISGSLKNNASRRYRIQWISPDGKIFQEEKFKSSFWNETFIKKSIQFNPPIQDTLIGRWRVRVWKKNTLIDDRFFEIVK